MSTPPTQSTNHSAPSINRRSRTVPRRQTRVHYTFTGPSGAPKPDEEVIRDCLSHFYARYQPDWSANNIDSVTKEYATSYPKLETLWIGLMHKYGDAPDGLLCSPSSATVPEGTTPRGKAPSALSPVELEKTSTTCAYETTHSNSREMENLRKELQSLRRELQHHKQRIVKLEQVNGELEQRLGLKDKEVLALARENEALQEEQVTITASSTKNSGVMAQLDDAYQEIERQREHLEKSNTTLAKREEEKISLQRQLAEASSKSTNYASLQSHLQYMEELLDNKTERGERQFNQLHLLEREKAELEGTNAALAANNAALLAHMEQLQRELNWPRPQKY